MISIKVSKIILDQLAKDFEPFIIEKNVGYILFVIKTNENTITAYNNKKGEVFKVTIQGENQLELAQKYSKDPLLISKKKNYDDDFEYLDIDFQIGSDEVGTGDFLGPIVVCAAYVDQSVMPLLKEYGITDSKKLSDKKILDTIPLLLKKVHYEVKMLSNKKYNNAQANGFNMNKIKAILHDHVLFKLSINHPYVKSFYIDQFCSEDKYDEYLKGVKKLNNTVVFKEKGEMFFPSIALASCIARYYFLQEMIRLSTIINKKIPLGAGKEVDDFAIFFIEKYGIDKFKDISKNNFANYKKAINTFDSLV